MRMELLKSKSARTLQSKCIVRNLFSYEGQSQCDPAQTMSHSILGLDLSDEHFPAMLKEISFEDLRF